MIIICVVAGIVAIGLLVSFIKSAGGSNSYSADEGRKAGDQYANIVQNTGGPHGDGTTNDQISISCAVSAGIAAKGDDKIDKDDFADACRKTVYSRLGR